MLTPLRRCSGLLVPLALLALWQTATCWPQYNPYIIPSPGAAWAAAKTLAVKGLLAKHIFISMQRVFSGFALAACLALPLGLYCGRHPWLNRLLTPLLEFLRHIPPLATIPMLILWFGIGEIPKLTIIVMAAFFPIFLNTEAGVRQCDAKLLEVGQTLRFSPWQLLRHIIWPAALPAVLVGLQLGLGYSWRALIGAELIAASSGIGYMILDAEQLSRPDIILVGILAIGLVGSLFDALFFRLAHRSLPYLPKGALPHV